MILTKKHVKQAIQSVVNLDEDTRVVTIKLTSEVRYGSPSMEEKNLTNGRWLFQSSAKGKYTYLNTLSYDYHSYEYNIKDQKKVEGSLRYRYSFVNNPSWDTNFIPIFTLSWNHDGNTFNASANMCPLDSNIYYIKSTGHGWEGKSYVFNFYFGN